MTVSPSQARLRCWKKEVKTNKKKMVNKQTNAENKKTTTTNERLKYISAMYTSLSSPLQLT
jgi:hypothetical protein